MSASLQRDSNFHCLCGQCQLSRRLDEVTQELSRIKGELDEARYDSFVLRMRRRLLRHRWRLYEREVRRLMELKQRLPRTHPPQRQ
jgi:hypothetical protein